MVVERRLKCPPSKGVRWQLKAGCALPHKPLGTGGVTGIRGGEWRGWSSASETHGFAKVESSWDGLGGGDEC